MQRGTEPMSVEYMSSGRCIANAIKGEAHRKCGQLGESDLAAAKAS